MSFHVVKLILQLNFLDLTDKFCYFLLCRGWQFVLFYCFCDWQQKPNFTACSEGEGVVVFCSYIQKLSINSLHGLLREWVFLLISPNAASCCLWLAQPGREDGWICHWLVNCVAGLSLTSGLWLLSGSIQNKLADCSHISHSICFDFVECSP